MIPRSDELSIGQRIVLTIIIVLVILFAFALAGWITGRWDEAPAATSWQHSQFDPQLATLEHTALDDAFMQRVHVLFRNWLDDERGQPDRMLVGIDKARRIYIQAMTEVQKREQ